MSRWEGIGNTTTLNARDEGSGGQGGIVLPLDLVGSGVYDVAYTLPIQFGQSNQQFSLQIDTGSSDLWVASTDCSSSTCGQTNGHVYNPRDARPTGVDFRIVYLQGLAAGPIYWDSVTVGGYTIANQAFAAANDVQNEPLGPKFSGILGLALPLNSVIASNIPPVVDNSPDGAAWASNLFSITPTENAPAARFLSLALSRPGSDRIPSVLGIGRHPAAIVPDPSKIQYTTLVSDRPGILFWKASVRAITVYVDGQPKPVNVGRSNTGGVFPSAVIDSGVPLILTTSTIANAIYGAIGVSPAGDGQYYVPCTTPLNMTITIDDLPPIPLHPLDLTAEPPEDNKATFCIGIIQAADAALTQPDSAIGDIILGVPFMRNVYTVMAYSVPDADGTFPTSPASGVASTISPRIGLLSLTDPTIALEEFRTVRILNQPIPPSNATTVVTNSDSNTVNLGGKKLSVGIVVLIGLVSFFAFCLFAFGLWRFIYRQRIKRKDKELGDEVAMDKTTAYMLARRESGGHLDFGPSEDELRQRRYLAHTRRDRIQSGSTFDSDRTQVAAAGKGGDDEYYVEEFGLKKHLSNGTDEEVWDPRTGLLPGGDTLEANQRAKGLGSVVDVPLTSDQDLHSPPVSPESHFFPPEQFASDDFTNSHRHIASVDIPLLSAQHPHQVENSDTYGSNHSAQASYSTRRYGGSPPLSPAQEVDYEGYDELGLMNGVTMAGVGTASRTSKISQDSAFRDSIRIDSYNRDSMLSMSSGGTMVGISAGFDPSNRGFYPSTARPAKSPLSLADSRPHDDHTSPLPSSSNMTS